MLSPHPGNGSETESLHHHQQHINTSSAASQTGGSSSGSVNGCLNGSSSLSGRRSGSGSNASGNAAASPRCKSALSYQQLQQLTSGGGDSSSGDLPNGRYSPHPNEMYLHHHGKLSIQPIDRYDDGLGCCLPPPSPAPNSDRFIMGLAPPGGLGCGLNGGPDNSGGNSPGVLHIHASYGSGNYDCAKKPHPSQQPPPQQQPHHHQQQQQQQSLSSSTSTSSLSTNASGGNYALKYASGMTQCAISPNARFRMSDRFREPPNTAKPTIGSLDVGGGSSSSGGSNQTGVYANTGGHAPARYVSSTHFLTQSTPLVSSDTYTYLSSTVHTPVKRYVPTPPPPNELYADTSMPPPPVAPGKTTPASNGNGGGGGGGHNTPQHVNTLPYRFRVKCCSNGDAPSSVSPHQQQPQQQPLPTNTSHLPHYMEHRALSVADYYATSPRNRTRYAGTSGSSGKCTASGKDSPMIILHEQQQQQQMASGHKSSANSSSGSGASTASSCLSSDSSNASSSTSPMTVSGSGGGGARGMQRASACMISDYASRTPSIEYINTAVAAAAANSGGNNGRAYTPVNVTATVDNSGEPTAGNSNSSASNTNGATCLHCNTVRRTTGVHQTTQTTGPISPIPLPPVIGGNSTAQHCLGGGGGGYTHDAIAAALTPSSSESHISPLSPTGVNGAPASASRAEQLHQQQSETQAALYLEPSPKTTQNVASQSGNADGLLAEQQSPLSQQPGGSRALPLQHCALTAQPIAGPPPQLPSLQPAPPPSQQQQQPQQRYSRKKRVTQYVRKEIARFFGVDPSTELDECVLWRSRQRRLALRRFGAYKTESELHAEMNNPYAVEAISRLNRCGNAGGLAGSHHHHPHQHHRHASERPDILPAQDAQEDDLDGMHVRGRHRHFVNADFRAGDHVERKASVASMLMASVSFIVHTLNSRQPRSYRQWSRSFAPAHVTHAGNGNDNPSDNCEGLTALQEEEVFFDTPSTEQVTPAGGSSSNGVTISTSTNTPRANASGIKMIEHQRQLYLGERMHGWRTSALMGSSSGKDSPGLPAATGPQQPPPLYANAPPKQQQTQSNAGLPAGPLRGNRIAAQLLDGVLENSRRPMQRRVKLFSVNDLDDRTDHRPFFTYWINTVQILVLCLALICYGVGPVGIGVEQKTGQVLVTSLSLQTVQHTEQRNVWIGPRNNDLVHMGAKFATCMRSDVRIMDVLLKTRRQERETACCIRNDDSGCVQSSQADCSVRGLYPTKSISTWKKWSPGESGPGGRISGSVCGLDPKFCDAPASIAPYEWPDDITKWPICRKTNSFSQRFRYKDHTAEHMVCEVIGHPCCTGVYGECRITTREYCDFVNGYFHEEASLCSQISCLNNVCGMFPFFSVEVPDQFYRLFTSLCLHAGILHLAITIAFQHVFLADLERLIGPIRAAIVYIGSGLAGNLTSAVLVPYKPEVGPLASLCGVVASLVVLLILIHWKQLRKPHIALFKLILLVALLFGIGTLPWQLNFAGLLAGIFCGMFLTIALIPFVSVSKYTRKSKINLIWTCIIFHVLVYSLMLTIFYAFPTEITSLNVGEFLSNGFNSNLGSGFNAGTPGSASASNPTGTGTGGANIAGGIGIGIDGGGVLSSINVKSTTQHQQQQQFYYPHRYDDIITNAMAAFGRERERENSKIAHLLKPPMPTQAQLLSGSSSFYHRAYHPNRQTSSGNGNGSNKNNSVTNKYKYGGSIMGPGGGGGNLEVNSNNKNNNNNTSSSSINVQNSMFDKSKSKSNIKANYQQQEQEQENVDGGPEMDDDEEPKSNSNNKNKNTNMSINTNKNSNNNNNMGKMHRGYASGGYLKSGRITNHGGNSSSSGYNEQGQSVRLGSNGTLLCPNGRLMVDEENDDEVVYLVEADTDAAAKVHPLPQPQQQQQQLKLLQSKINTKTP